MPVEHVGVVVPAREEEATLPRTLASLDVAADRARRAGVRVDVVVVLDRCLDGSADIVARWPGVVGVTCEEGNVGVARSVGCDLLLGSGSDPAAHPDWLACTDADSVVPGSWLVRQVDLADRGADAVIGTVQPDDELPFVRADQWWRRHRLTERHGHVHGANLGVRSSSYVAVGGFAALATGEDRDLVARLRSAGVTCVATDSVRVTTSSRLAGRAPAGFASYLRALPG